jgi:hypothetical protein
MTTPDQPGWYDDPARFQRAALLGRPRLDTAPSAKANYGKASARTAATAAALIAATARSHRRRSHRRRHRPHRRPPPGRPLGISLDLTWTSFDPPQQRANSSGQDCRANAKLSLLL